MLVWWVANNDRQKTLFGALQLCLSYRLDSVDEKTRLKIHQKVAARATPSGSAREGTSSRELQKRMEWENVQAEEVHQRNGMFSLNSNQSGGVFSPPLQPPSDLPARACTENVRNVKSILKIPKQFAKNILP